MGETQSMPTRLFIGVVFTLWLAALPAAAELRQWTDENGVKHFSNRKELPEGVSVERSIEEKESHPGEQHKYRKTVPATRSQSTPGQTYGPRSNPNKAAVLKKIRTREAKLNEIFERIYTKRRYVKRHGKQDIDIIRRLNSEIEALEKKGTDPANLKQLQQERAAAKKRLFNENLRTRKGVGEDIQKYKQIEDEIAELKKRL
jgi:hypothetical protein